MVRSSPGSKELVERVLSEARARGFLGPGPIEAHYRHALGFVDVLRRELVLQPAGTAGAPPGGAPEQAGVVRADTPRLTGDGHILPDVLDLGSGGGLPGLVIALEMPTVGVVLLESSSKRAEFLRWAVEQAALHQSVTVCEARAEEAGRRPERRGRFRAVVARSFGPPPVTAECAAPFLRVGGALVVSEPATAALDLPEDGGRSASTQTDETRWPPAGLQVLGLTPERRFLTPFALQLLRQTSPCPDKFPRRVGVPAKRPLF